MRFGTANSVLVVIGLTLAQAVSAQTESYVFKEGDGFELRADVYGVESAEPAPTVLWIHGGALIFGNRSWVRPEFVEFCRREGFILVSMDYRLAPESKLPEIVSDVEDAYRWVRQQGPALFGVDSTRIAVAGNSAGGYLTMMMGTTEQPKPATLVSYWGYGQVDDDWYTQPHYHDGDLSMVSEGMLRDGNGRLNRNLYYIYLRQQARWTHEVTGFDPATEGDDLRAYNPVLNVTPDYPPMLMVHGTDDNDVPYSASVEMSAALKEHGVIYELVPVPDAGHELESADPTAVANAHARAEAFLARHLRRE